MLRLKENFSRVSRDKETLAEENRQLRQLLAQHGIPWHGTGGVDELARNASVGYTSSGSISGSYAPGSQTYSPAPATTTPGHAASSPPPGRRGPPAAPPPGQPGLDYDQAGIDFVLTYAKHPSSAYLSPPPQ